MGKGNEAFSVRKRRKMNDNDFNAPEGEPEEIAQRIIDENDQWIKSLTNSCNECRDKCDTWSLVWIYFHSAITVSCIVGQLFNPCTSIAIAIILYGHTVTYFMIRNTEKTWDNLIQDNERAILRAMDRKQAWVDFLKEYRGY